MGLLRRAASAAARAVTAAVDGYRQGVATFEADRREDEEREAARIKTTAPSQEESIAAARAMMGAVNSYAFQANRRNELFSTWTPLQEHWRGAEEIRGPLTSDHLPRIDGELRWDAFERGILRGEVDLLAFAFCLVGYPPGEARRQALGAALHWHGTEAMRAWCRQQSEQTLIEYFGTSSPSVLGLDGDS